MQPRTPHEAALDENLQAHVDDAIGKTVTVEDVAQDHAWCIEQEPKFFARITRQQVEDVQLTQCRALQGQDEWL